MQAEGFLLSILHQQLTAVEQSWLWNKSSLQKKKKTELRTKESVVLLKFLLKLLIFLYYAYPLTHATCLSYIYLEHYLLMKTRDSLYVSLYFYDVSEKMSWFCFVYISQ